MEKIVLKNRDNIVQQIRNRITSDFDVTTIWEEKDDVFLVSGFAKDGDGEVGRSFHVKVVFEN